jgi:membrane protein insertase Oxa1/YidC/SpoIIIJ
MLTLLDTVVIAPLLEIYGFIFDLISPSYSAGWRIILFSLLVNLLLVPVYAQMERQSRRVREKQSAMESEVQRLKRHFKGRERYFYLRTLYRQHNFRHWRIVFSSSELFVQIMVFATVYIFVSNLKFIQGASFGPIADLGKPDALLGGFNALPVIMTCVNAVSLAFYVRTKSKLYQGVGLAILFFVILYPSAAALVLYWTTNNVFSLIRNVHLRSGRAIPQAEDSGTESARAEAPVNSVPLTPTVAGFPGFAIFILSVSTAAFLIFVWVPITTFLTSPGELRLHLEYLVATNAKSAMVCVYLAALIYCFVAFFGGRDSARVVGQSSLFVLLVLLLYAYVMPFGYPMLTGLAFELPPMELGHLFLRIAVDVLVLIVAFGVFRVLLARLRPRSILTALALLNVSLAAIAGVGLMRDEVGGYGNVSEVGQESRAFLEFSKEDPNVLILFLDRFMGGLLNLYC